MPAAINRVPRAILSSRGRARAHVRACTRARASPRAGSCGAAVASEAAAAVMVALRVQGIVCAVPLSHILIILFIQASFYFKNISTLMKLVSWIVRKRNNEN